MAIMIVSRFSWKSPSEITFSVSLKIQLCPYFNTTTRKEKFFIPNLII